MPILFPKLWRFVLKGYLQVFLLCVGSLVAALFVMRFKDIAQFATLQADGASIALFILYQLPYVLPLAIPISSLVASTLLFQRLTQSQELTALRAGGVSLKSVIMPVMMLSVVLCFVNFLVTTEIGPRFRWRTKELRLSVTANNPFYIFNKIADGKLTNAHVDMKTLNSGKKAQDVLLMVNQQARGRLSLMAADTFSVQGSTLIGKHVSVISTIDAEQPDQYDHLIIENQESMTTPTSTISHLLQETHLGLGAEYLPLSSWLLAPQYVGGASYILELGKQLSLSLAPFALTLVGAAYPIEVGRGKKTGGILRITALTLVYLACFMGAKSLKHFPMTAWALYLIPLGVLALVALRKLQSVSRGIE